MRKNREKSTDFDRFLIGMALAMSMFAMLFSMWTIYQYKSTLNTTSCQCPKDLTVLEPTTIFQTSNWSPDLSVIAPEPSVTPDPGIKPPEMPAKPPKYGFTPDDIYLLTTLLCGSKDVDGDGEFDIDFGRSDEYDQISLVLNVVMNRVNSDKYPNTVSEVVWGVNQFAVMPQWRNGLPTVSDASYKIVEEWCIAYDSWDPAVQTISESHLYFSGDGYKNHSR